MTPHDPRAADAVDRLIGEVERMSAHGFEMHRAWFLDALAAAGLHVVAEGHAVIDGEVVALELNEVVSLRGRLRWDAWNAVTTTDSTSRSTDPGVPE